MRVGIYDPYLDDIGGGEKYMLTIAEVLSKEHRVTIFWNNRDDLEKCIKRFSLDLAGVKLASNIFSADTPKLSRILRSQMYDIIIFHSDGSFPFVLSKKLFVHIQRPIEQAKPSVLSRLKIRRINAIFCNSEFTKSYIDKTFHINSKVILPPVALDPKDIKKGNIILHVGRFRVMDKTVDGVTDLKKQYVMLKVFKEMVDQGLKNWKLVMAVSIREKDKEALDEVKKQAKDYPIEFEVDCTNASLWDLYSQAKIYWHASGFGEDLERHPELAEHFGMSTIEAMGAGAVPIVINAGGQKEIVTNGKNGLTWNTLSELKEKTLRVMNSQTLWEELSKNAKIRAQDFSKEQFNKRIEELLFS